MTAQCPGWFLAAQLATGPDRLRRRVSRQTVVPTKMDELQALWVEHLAASFPDECRGTEVAGIDLLLLDADIAGCVDTYLNSGRTLDEGKMTILRKCRDEAAAVVTRMQEPAKSYFQRLALMAESIAANP